MQKQVIEEVAQERAANGNEQVDRKTTSGPSGQENGGYKYSATSQRPGGQNGQQQSDMACILTDLRKAALENFLKQSKNLRTKDKMRNVR